MVQSIANVMDIIQGITGCVEVLFRANNVNIFSISDTFANERNVLQTEHCPLVFHDLFRSTKGILGLPVEGTLSENRTDQTTFREVVSNLFQNADFSMGGRRDQNNVRSGNDIFGL